MPQVGEEIIIDFGNGMGTNKNKPYLVEVMELEFRGHDNPRYARKVVKVEGRQILKSGKLKDVWFELFFSNILLPAKKLSKKRVA